MLAAANYMDLFIPIAIILFSMVILTIGAIILFSGKDKIIKIGKEAILYGSAALGGAYSGVGLYDRFFGQKNEPTKVENKGESSKDNTKKSND